MSREAKIGLIGLIGILTFFILVPSSNTRDSKLLQNTYKFVLDDGNRLTEGSEVKFAGYSVGQIAAIDFTTAEERVTFGEDANIIVTVHTDAGVRIPEDSTIGVVASSTGNICLDLQPGLSKTMIEPNTTIRLLSGYSTDPARFAKASALLSNLATMTKGFRNSVSSESFQTNMLDLASNARFYTNEAKVMTQDLPAKRAKFNAKLDKYENMAMQQIDRINVQIDLGAKRLKDMRPRFSAKLTKVQTKIDSLQDQLDGMLATAKTETERFKAISEKAEQGTDKLINDPVYRAKLRQAADKLDKLATTCEDIHSITSDPSVREGLQKLVHQYRDQSEAIKNKMERWEGLVPGSATAAAPRTTPTPVRVDSSAIIKEPAANNGTATPAANDTPPTANDAVPTSGTTAGSTASPVGSTTSGTAPTSAGAIPTAGSTAN